MRRWSWTSDILEAVSLSELALMEGDILSIHMSIMASESAFNVGVGCLINTEVPSNPTGINYSRLVIWQERLISDLVNSPYYQYDLMLPTNLQLVCWFQTLLSQNWNS